ncbi:unnamed protein product [Protopolystoma xenopodis]|uniref:Uncharacterized protein n=1 Tax=Protopolystoma xenopodis TaxID=117903 RepID=A0A448WA88_9PLAT|nr:unnamed protein product [Protopolystoma xenopodis]
MELGPVVICVCPSELYWLQLMLRRMNSIWEEYSAPSPSSDTSSTAAVTAIPASGVPASTSDLNLVCFSSSGEAVHPKCYHHSRCIMSQDNELYTRCNPQESIGCHSVI